MDSTAAIDDLDSRPGSTTSLLRTIVGLYLRRLGGWIAIADLVRMMEDLGVPAMRTRTAVARVKQKGLLFPDKRDAVGYRLNPAVDGMLARGDRRIFDVRQMRAGDPWCLISFSVPETHRDLRHQLRRRLQWIGCGIVSPALWVCPDYLSHEVEQVLREPDLKSPRWVLFRTEEPRVATDLSSEVQSWWDLDRLRAEHDLFLETVERLTDTPVETDRDAFVAYVSLVDSWRILPYVDPGLPPHVLPPDWPGQRSIDSFARLSGILQDPAWSHVSSTAHRPSSPWPALPG